MCASCWCTRLERAKQPIKKCTSKKQNNRQKHQEKMSVYGVLTMGDCKLCSILIRFMGLGLKIDTFACMVILIKPYGYNQNVLFLCILFQKWFNKVIGYYVTNC